MLMPEEIKCLVLSILRSTEGSKSRRRNAARLLLEHGPNSVEGKSALRLITIKSFKEAEEELLKADKAGVSVVLFNESVYPNLLRFIPDSPPLLFVRGNLCQNDSSSLRISIVGNRQASESYRKFAYEMAKELTLRGVSITSGLALGIDSAAHCGAIRAKVLNPSCSPGMGILGSGVLSVYPAKNKKLAEELINYGGAIVSEYEISASPRKHHFPERNRIISGVSHGTIVVEAKSRSGSLITARLALEQGRDVMAVPGCPGQSSSGTNALIKQGAFLVETVEDVLDCFPWFKPAIREKDDQMSLDKGVVSNLPEERILSVLQGCEYYGCDALAELLNFSIGELMQHITSLELKGRVYRHPGDVVSLSSYIGG